MLDTGHSSDFKRIRAQNTAWMQKRSVPNVWYLLMESCKFGCKSFWGRTAFSLMSIC